MFDLTGRVAILTGGAGMLGRQYTRTLLEAGCKVVVADVSAEQAASAARDATLEAGSEAVGYGVDVRQKAAVDQMVAAVEQRFGRIDILINNAAIDPKFDSTVAAQQANTFEDYPLELWQQSLDVNLTGAFLCSQAAGKVMVRQQQGVVVNICSTYGLVAPDKITIFRGPILRVCPPDEAAIRAQVRRTVLHEIAHHFGISDERLHALGAY